MDDNKRYKATDIKVDGPFEGWIIEELTEEEMEKEEAKAKEMAEKMPKKTPSGQPQKLTPEELQKKRDEQLNKIKELINQKRKEKLESQKQTQTQTQTQPQPQNMKPQQNMTYQEKEVVSPSLRQEEDLETMLIRKSKETGIPVEVLRMIEEKKKELRERKKNQSGNPTGGGVEMYDTVKARREKEEAERYYAEHQERKPVRKAPNGEEIGDRQSIMPEEKSHDLYNVMDDVGLDEDR